ncbi:MAG TPA: hypothetical protein VK254_00120 [Candidatus Bathyarchaeia archaeon]|nr:hypothetical protein [Candidatus Bathyarchaeia archaeon]
MLSSAFLFGVHVSNASYGKIYPDGTHIKTETTWKKSESPYLIEGSLTFDIGSSLTIEPGVIVKLKYKKGALNVFGGITAVGTQKDRIIFTSERDDFFGGDVNGDGETTRPDKGDWFTLNIGGDGGPGEIKYASILYAGGSNWNSEALMVNNRSDFSLTKSEIKFSWSQGLAIIGAPPKPIRENIIAYNRYCGVYGSMNGRTADVQYNSIFENGCGAKVWLREDVIQAPRDRLDARNCWWGDPSGPQYRSTFGWPDNRSGKGNVVLDGVIIDPWLGKDSNVGPDPVIVIPGIMGSWKVDGEWKIDPIFHTYDNLRDEFLANGYESGKNYFEFPYEWRDSNVDNAKLLRDKINRIKADTGRLKVDIVAHSMGGLLAREYIESDYYNGDVDQLITVGTPQLGAPKDYVKWEAGAFFSDIFETAGKYFLNQEAKENGFDSVFHYIRGLPMDSVRELLPAYDYLYDDNGSSYDLRSGYPTNYPRNEFLENLNNVEKIKTLKNVEFTKIIGKQNTPSSTISGFNVINAGMGELWEHGYPHGFEMPWIGDQGLRKSDGDGTVSLNSAEASNLVANKTLYFQSGHNNLPTDAQKDIIEIFTGKKPASEFRKWHIPSLLLIDAHSPIDIQVESPSGQKIGKNFVTNGIYDEIEGAYYTGFDTNSEFITIPNPEEGKYKIISQGTGKGNYRVEVADIAENPDDPGNAKESSVSIEGSVQLNEIQGAEVEISGDEVIYESDTTPPAISISSPEEMDYTNDKTLTIDFKAEDPESGIESENWQMEKDGQNLNWTEKNVDLSLEYLGNYTLKIVAVDKAENSNEKQVNFQITTSLDAIRKNVGHYFHDLNLISGQEEFDYFQARLIRIESLFERMKGERKNKKSAEKIQKEICLHIDHLIDHIKKSATVCIDQKAADLLIEDLEYIKNF